MGAFANFPILSKPDPVLLFMNTKWMMLAAGQIELLFGVLLVMEPHTWRARYGLLAFCATFVVYRAAILWLGAAEHCPRLGRASDWLQLTARRVDSMALLLLETLGAMAITSIVAHTKDSRNHFRDRNGEITS